MRNYLEWSDRGRPAVWRYALAVILGFVCWTFGNVPAILLLGPYLHDPATKTATLQYTFAVGLLAVLLIVRLLLGRPAYSVALPSWPPRWLDYVTGILLGWGAMLLTYLLLSPITSIAYLGWDAALGQGVPLLLVTLGGFAIQTAFEEVFFRGLVAQAVRRLTKWLPLVLLLPALWFAQLHIGNVAAFGNRSTAMLPYLVDALLLAWVAWRTGSLLMSMGLHFAFNTFLTILVNTAGDVVSSAAPFVADAPTLPRAVLFGLVRASMIVGFVEFLVRRRAAPDLAT